MLDAQLKKKRLNKLNPQAHIGYLVGYNSINIYRIWIPHKGIVISIRDIIFDEKTFFDGKWTNITKDLHTELDMLIEKIQLPDTQTKNEVLLEDNKEIFELSIQEEDNDVKDEPV